MSETDLSLLARQVRTRLVEISCRKKVPHLASSLSCVEIMLAAYWNVLKIDPMRPDDPDRDRLIFSKGHAAATLYTVLQKRGFISEETLDAFPDAGTALPEHPSPGCAPGVEAAAGSLGHGLSIGLGLVCAAAIARRSYRVYTVMSDGECNEGSVWEAAMLAPAKHADNLVAIVDCNKWQATARCRDVSSLYPLADKWAAFGWSAHEVDGHDVDALTKILRNVPDGTGRPVAVIAHTIKGRGISFMEDDNNWHYRIPNEQEYALACRELA